MAAHIQESPERGMGKRLTGAVMARWMPSTTREDLPWWRSRRGGIVMVLWASGREGTRSLVPGAWFPFSRCLVPRCRGGWIRHDIVSMGGGVFGRDAGIKAGLEGCFFQRHGPAPQRPNAHSLPIGWRPTVQGRYAQWGPVAWHIRIKARRGHMQAPLPQIALKARIH